MKTPRAQFVLPGINDRVAVVGATGSGKTQFAAWMLSEARFDLIPYVMVNYKRDELLESIPRVIDIGYNEIPSIPGVYQIAPLPSHVDEMEDWLMRIWARENIGLLFDEAFMVPDKRRGAFTAILTQGRSKRIPAIICSQRPVLLPKFVYTESQYYAVFRLQNQMDKKKIGEYVPDEAIGKNALSEFCCEWYDVRRNKLLRLSKVPDADVILQTFEDRLKPEHTSL